MSLSHSPPVPPSTVLEGSENPARSQDALYDLKLSFSDLGRRLTRAMAHADQLNAYLFAAALNQIAEDYIHADICYLGAAGNLLLASGGRMRVVAGRVAGGTLSGAQELRSHRRPVRATLAWQRELAKAVDRLAREVHGASRDAEPDALGLEDRIGALVSAAERLPAGLRRRTLKLPACFQAFDLDVPDIVRLADEFVRRHPDRSRPLLVAGVRTSGSYLAPLCAAVLEAQGYCVRVITLRPQHSLLRSERTPVRGSARGRALALVIDDPPESGHTVSRVADKLARLGFPPASIVLLLPVFGDQGSLPTGLRRYPSVLLPAEDWTINTKLTPEAVGSALRRLFPAETQLRSAQSIPLPAQRQRRGHRRGLFRVGLLENGAPRTVRVLVEGVGIGYFGEQTIEVASRLSGHVPEVFGLRGGCLYRAWQPEERRACPPGGVPTGELVTAVATYVDERRRALPVAEDRSLDESGERPVWEVAGAILSRPFGRGAQIARVVLVDSLSKRLLRVTRPTVTDGATSLANWFADERRPGRFVKVDFAKRSFWNLGLLCYDALFDLAGAAVSSSVDSTADQLRSAYTRLVGEPIGEERWFLYQLAQLSRRGQPDAEDATLQRERARAVQRYFARVYLSDLEPAPGGPLCALDLDGVLETETLGFPATTAAGAMALRALVAHGYRPVIVSGRSAGEVADRCHSYGLAGGVAEYGAVVYTAETGKTEVRLSDADRALLALARETLTARAGVHVDDAYRYTVRAFVTDRRGRRRPLDAATAGAALAASGEPARLKLVVGECQTDFVSAAVDKGSGIRALAPRIGRSGDTGPLLALAMGDTVADLPLLREASLALAPSQARRTLRHEGVGLMRAPYQAGLAAGVGRLLGHEPGACPACRAPQLGPESALLVALLSAGEGGRLGLTRRFLRLWRLSRYSTC